MVTQGYTATLVAATLAISGSSLYYRKKPRGSRADRQYDEPIVVACGLTSRATNAEPLFRKQRYSSKAVKRLAAARGRRFLLVVPNKKCSEPSTSAP